MPRLLDLPPVWLVATMALMWGLARMVPIVAWDSTRMTFSGWVVIAAAIVLTAAAAIHFRQQRTSIIPRREATAFITGGPYRFSRNPIYLADVLVLAGWFLILGALSPIVMIPLFMAVIQRRFIRQEEALLHRTFGTAFDDYSGSTRRWL